MIDVLFGTTNKTKRDRFQELFKPLGLNILTLTDMKIESIAEEKGKTPTENAESKALFYVEKVGIPTFAIDYGLYIEKFPDDEQPGLFVRRIHGDDREVSDEELLNYYISELEKVGGESPGVWVSAISLALSPNEVFSEEFSEDTLFISKKSLVVTPGEPLSSIQIHPITKKIKSEMSPEDRVKNQDVIDKGFLAFMRKHF